MKKTLLLISFLMITFAAWAADPNAYAYGASMSFDAEKNELTVNWNLNATASSVKIVAIDKQQNKYELEEYLNVSPGAHPGYKINLTNAIDAGLPTDEELKIQIEVTTAARSTHQLIGKKVTMQSPFSIDIDNNPESKYYGLIYVTQMDGSI